MNVKYFFFGLMIAAFICGSAQGQRPQERLTGMGIRPMPAPVEEVSSPWQRKSSLELPFRDDFSRRNFRPNPARWEDDQVYINSTLGRSPITIGVATFDGLDRYGRAYNPGSHRTDTADMLTSQPINLQNPSDSVYLSFYFQAGGNGEPPSREDSLIVEFWNVPDSTWVFAWGSLGGQDQPHEFEQVMLAVPSDFHHDDFRFRFTSYGSGAGAFDHWHLDYVRLDEGRNYNDTLLLDIAFTRPHPSLLVNYESIPWFHLDQAIDPAALAKDDIRLHYRRNVDPTGPRPTLFLGEFDIRYQGTVVDQNGAPDVDLAAPHQPLVEERFPVPDTADGGRARLDWLDPNGYPDEFEIVSTHYYSGGNQSFSANDTVRKRQQFKNYYAYDDGSAERGFEILNNGGNFIVQKYDLISTDTLRGLYIYFVPAFYGVEQNEFSIIVLENDGGLPGQVLFESDSLYVPQFTDPDFYQPYVLDSLEEVFAPGQTVFIGIRQQRDIPLTLGYDLNRQDVTEAFYGRTDDLFQSFLPGVIMMRPFFRYLPRDISISEREMPRLQFALYPNPASTFVNVAVDKPGFRPERWRYRLRNSSGQVLRKGEYAERIEVGELAPGLYFFEMENKRGGRSTQKLLLR